MTFRRDYGPDTNGSDDGYERMVPERERDSWYSEDLRYHVWGTLEKYEEARRRNDETTRRMVSIYCSYKIIGILAADTLMSLLLFPPQYFVVGLIGSNFLVFVVVLFCCYNVSKARVRQEIRKRHLAVLIPPQDNALRKS